MKENIKDPYDKELVEKYPNLYVDMWGDSRKTCMAQGVCVGEGWRPIINELSEALEKEIVKVKQKMNSKKIQCANCGVKQRWHKFFYILRAILYPIINRWRKIRVKIKRKKYTVYESLFYYFLAKVSNRKFNPKNIWVTEGYFRNKKYKVVKNPNGISYVVWNKENCKEFTLPIPRAAQVKQKLGGLRFYMNYSNEKMEKLISKASQKSYKICEDCGEEGKLRTENRRWTRTLCDKCDLKK